MRLLRIYVSAGDVAAVVAWLLVVISRVVAFVLGDEMWWLLQLWRFFRRVL